MFKLKTLFICCGVSLLVGAGITCAIGAYIIGGILSEYDKNLQLAESRAANLSAELDTIKSTITEASNITTEIIDGLGDSQGGVSRALEYNRQLEKILSSAKTLE